MKYNSLPRPRLRDLGSAYATLYDVLIMMENDEEDYSVGCNWGYVKGKTTLSQIKDVSNDNLARVESSDGLTLNMKKWGSLASQFLICVRNGFAHNCITYNPQTNILMFDVNDSKGNLALQGEISNQAFIEIINLIKESKNQPKTK